MYYVIQCRFSELLFQLCIKNAFFLGPCRNITTMCRKIAFFLGPCRNITIQGHQGQGVPGVPCRAIFSGREEILIFGEIFTSVLLPCSVGNVIGFGVVSDSGRQARLIAKSFRLGLTT